MDKLPPIILLLVALFAIFGLFSSSTNQAGAAIYVLNVPFFIQSVIENSLGSTMNVIALSTNPLSENGDQGLNPYHEGTITVLEPISLSYTDESVTATSMREGYDGSTIRVTLPQGNVVATGLMGVNDVLTTTSVTGLATFSTPTGPINYFQPFTMQTASGPIQFGTNRFYCDVINTPVPFQNDPLTNQPVCIGTPVIKNGLIFFPSTLGGSLTTTSICTTGQATAIYNVPVTGGTPTCASAECQGTLGNAINVDYDSIANMITYVSNRQNPALSTYTLVVRDLASGTETLPHLLVGLDERNPTIGGVWVAVERYTAQGTQIILHNWGTGTSTPLTPANEIALDPHIDFGTTGTDTVLTWVQLNPNSNLMEIKACFPNIANHCQNPLTFTDGVNTYRNPKVKVRGIQGGMPIFDIIVAQGFPTGSLPSPYPSDLELWSWPTATPQFASTQVQLTSTLSVTETPTGWATQDRVGIAFSENWIGDPAISAMINLNTINTPITSTTPWERADFILPIGIQYTTPTSSPTGNFLIPDPIQDYLITAGGFSIHAIDISTPDARQINQLC